MTDNEISYRAAVRYARRHITECCYGRPCLEDCLRRLGASLPPCACAGGWRPPRWAKWLALAAVLAAVVFAALHARADVRCIWDGQTYVCSGEGARVEVIGGGSSEPVVVTNFWGVCTNCVAMSPSQCETLKQDLFDSVIDVQTYILSGRNSCGDIMNKISGYRADISTFRRFNLDSGSVVATRPDFINMTNYVYTVENTQTSLCRSYPAFSNLGNGSNRPRAISYCNGIYDYAQTVVEKYDSVAADVSGLVDTFDYASDRISALDSRVSDINCSECQADYEPGPDPDAGGSGGGSGGGSLTNGNWCTFDQGEAIKDLLRQLKDWAERQHSQLSAISNYVRASYETLRSGLYSDYTAIPRGEDWQNLYLNGQPTGWGYDPTNIIQRIEVLLYGISGISTNTPSLDDTTPSADDTVEDVSDATASIVTDADGTAATTLGNAVLGFFRAFTPRTKNYQGGEEIIAEVSIKVGNDTHYVPAMRLGSSGFLVDTMTAVKAVVSGLCRIIFWIGGAFVIFRFWAWFSAWCIRLSRWAVELCTSLFAS